jgi:predicted transcriptional regulator
MPLKDRYVMKKLNRETIGRNYIELYIRKALTVEVIYNNESVKLFIEDGKLKMEKSKNENI